MRIEDFAFLSDCQTAALVSTNGSVDWMCLPRFDSPSVFARILDPSAGSWMLAPLGTVHTVRDYLPDSLVLRTVHETEAGSVEVLDALVFEQGARGNYIGMQVPHSLVRVVRGLSGAVDMATYIEPRFEYGLTKPLMRPTDSGFLARGGPVELQLVADVAVTCSDHDASARFTVAAGDEFAFRLTFRDPYDPGTFPVFDSIAALEDTTAAWRSWVAVHAPYEGPFAAQVLRSALVLQGLTYQPAGSMVAAATTSLPERVGGDWNWDYRFTWLRDTSLTMTAYRVATGPREPWRFFEWIENLGLRSEGSPLQIMYDVEGRADLTEHTLSHLRGFRHSRPVRIGNDAWVQSQLDVNGEILDAAYMLREQLTDLPEAARVMLVRMADEAAVRWHEPDAGMWEFRGAPRHYVATKVMNWVALDRAVKMAELLGAADRIGVWSVQRDAVRAAVLREGWNDQVGAYTGAFGSKLLDASVLLLPIMGFLPADDERMRATIHAIDERLGTGGLVRRWAEEPNAFLICSYWLVQCLALAGERERATEYFETITSHANDLGLLAEMVELSTGDLLGNTPQAFSHIGLINAAWALSL